MSEGTAQGSRGPGLSKTQFRSPVPPSVTFLISLALFCIFPIVSFRPDLLPSENLIGPTLSESLDWIVKDYGIVIRNVKTLLTREQGRELIHIICLLPS